MSDNAKKDPVEEYLDKAADAVNERVPDNAELDRLGNLEGWEKPVQLSVGDRVLLPSGQTGRVDAVYYKIVRDDQHGGIASNGVLVNQTEIKPL